MIAPGTRVHLKHEHDPMFAAVANIPGLEYREVYGTVQEPTPGSDLNLVHWDAGDGNPWPDEALEVVE